MWKLISGQWTAIRRHATATKITPKRWIAYAMCAIRHINDMRSNVCPQRQRMSTYPAIVVLSCDKQNVAMGFRSVILISEWSAIIVIIIWRLGSVQKLCKYFDLSLSRSLYLFLSALTIDIGCDCLSFVRSVHQTKRTHSRVYLVCILDGAFTRRSIIRPTTICSTRF